MIEVDTKLKEHETVVLLRDVHDHSLRAGDVGAIVSVYEQHDVYDVEFTMGDGRPVAIVTLSSDQIRPLSGDDLFHVRRIESHESRV